MALLPNVFNVNDVPDDDFSTLEAGEYVGTIVDSEMKPTKSGDGAYLELKIQLENGRVLFERLNIQNKNETAMEMAFRTLRSICEAVGKGTIKDSTELHNKRLKVVVSVKAGTPYTDLTTGEMKQGRDQNEIKKYLPYNAVTGGDSSSSPAAAKGSTPPWRK